MLVSSDIYSLINYLSFVQWLSVGASVLGMVYLRYTRPEWDRPIKVSCLFFTLDVGNEALCHVSCLGCSLTLLYAVLRWSFQAVCVSVCVCVWFSGQLIAFWSVVWLHHSCMCCEMSVWSHCSVNEQVGLNKKKLLSLYLTGCFILLLYCEWYKQLPSHSLVARLVWTAF